MTAKKKGSDFERLIKKKLQQKGYFVIRSPGSKGPFDLIAITPKNHLNDLRLFPGPHILAIQCKIKGKISETEKQKILEISQKYGFIPMLARKFNRKPVLIDLRDTSTFLL